MCVVRTPHEQGRSENCERDTSRLGQKYLAIFLLGVSNSFFLSLAALKRFCVKRKRQLPPHSDHDARTRARGARARCAREMCGACEMLRHRDNLNRTFRKCEIGHFAFRMCEIGTSHFEGAKPDISHFAGAKPDTSHFAVRNRTLRTTGHYGARHSPRVSGAVVTERNTKAF